MLPRRRTPSLGFTAGRRTTRPRPARGLSEALAREVAGDQGVDERRFGVETVARLWPDARGRAVDDLVGDLLAAMGGQGVVPRRRGAPQLEAAERGGLDQRMADVVAVADEGDLDTGEAAELLLEGQDVRERLGGR